MSVVVITGSTKGVGFALAHEYARRGWSVVVSGRSQEGVEAARAAIGADVPGAQVAGAVVDVSSFGSVSSLWDAAVAAFARVDLWINNAGLAVSTKAIVDNDPGEISAMVTTNMLGTMYGSQVAATRMAAQPGGGRIVNVLGGGSDGSVREGQGVYSSTKRGLDLFTRALIKETKGTPVRVASVRPGILITEGFIREAHEMGPERFGENRKVINILGDRPGDVVPWIVDRLDRTTDKHGAEVCWLTTPKIAGRFATAFRKRDILTGYGI